MEQLHTDWGDVLESAFKNWQKTWTSATVIVPAGHEFGISITQVNGVTTQPGCFTDTYANL